MDWLHFALRRILRIRVRVNFGTGGKPNCAATTPVGARALRTSSCWTFPIALGAISFMVGLPLGKLPCKLFPSWELHIAPCGQKCKAFESEKHPKRGGGNVKADCVFTSHIEAN